MTSPTPENITDELPAEPQPKEITDDLITLIFPNYSTKPVRQTWRVRSLISIPYFRALLEREWAETKNKTLTLEDDPGLFSKMVRKVNAGTIDEQYDMMIDYYQADLNKKSSTKNQQFYKKLTFTADTLRQSLGLEEVSQIRKVVAASLTSSISTMNLRRRLFFYLDGSPNGKIEDSALGESYGRFLITVMNAMLATDGKLGRIEIRIEHEEVRGPGTENIQLPVFVYMHIVYKK